MDKNFTNLFSLSKTLRFELIPQRKTLEFIEQNGLLKQDEQRNFAYKKTKKLIDEYHKHFIEMVLIQVKLDNLTDFEKLYNVAKREDAERKSFEKIQIDMRKEISDAFTKHDSYNDLFAKELIKDLLPNFFDEEEIKSTIKQFDDFTTYFKGFHENRKNMYSKDEKSTAIAFRIVHQNLPKFIDNIKIFNKIIESEFRNNLEIIEYEIDAILQGEKLNEIFKIENYNNTLSQTQIDRYNYILGGYEEVNKTKVKGLNEFINLYNQQQKDPKNRLPKLKPLFKQILSDRVIVSFREENFENSKDVLAAIENFYQELIRNIFDTDTDNLSLNELLSQIDSFDVEKIYIRNDLQLTDISQKIFGNWNIINNALEVDFFNNYKGKKQRGTEDYEVEFNKVSKKNDSYAIGYLNRCLLQLENNDVTKSINQYYSSLGKNEMSSNLIMLMEEAYKICEPIIKSFPEDKDISQNDEAIEKIKLLLDSIKNIQHFIKPLLGKGNEGDKDEKFYAELDRIWRHLNEITSLYNKVRNFMTKKPYSTEKYKLNFENPELLGGWPINREIATSSLIFKDNNFFYLGILDKKNKSKFKNLPKPKNEEDIISKMNYLQAADPGKDVQNFMVIDGVTVKKNGRKEKGGENKGVNIQLEALKNQYLPADINEIRIKKSYSKLSEIFNKNDLIKFIDYYKERAKEYYSSYNFSFRNSCDYNDFGVFTDHINEQAYQVDFIEVSQDFIHQLVDEGKLYLFKIYNKDFSPHSKGTPNMHTIYWKMLFDKENLKNVVYKLNGEAEVFFRKKSIEPTNVVTHYANQPIPLKNKTNEGKSNTFNYNIIKDKRYTCDKFQFHVPITLNFKATEEKYFNELTNNYIKEGNIKHIIGIDRGERHLLYITLIDLDGNIINQISLNIITNTYNNNNYETDYNTLLTTKQGDRDKARKNWKTIENIKELKQGYLSQAIHTITTWMIQYKAIVVLEDLNMGFKNSRQKVDKSVYQKFEKMLIDKLNYLVDKNKKADELGGALNALQLTEKFESFAKMKNQKGFLYYVPAWNTSKIDPLTGFVNLFYTKYETIEKAQKFFQSFDDIIYNNDGNYFEFKVANYTAFNPKAEGTRQNWTICTYGDRIKTFRNPEKNNNWDDLEVNITEEFIKLFIDGNININDDLQKQIVKQNDKKFFEDLLYLFKLTLQMRNSKTNSDVDYMISPVANRNGEFYDSRNYEQQNAILPSNADANGAYHIAKKGLWIIEKIKKSENLKTLKLAITNKEWLNYIQSNS